jgi:hypothetical protein
MDDRADRFAHVQDVGQRPFFWGQRWLAWTSGWIMLAMVWLTGTMGYWLIWDQRAQWMTEL